jgi:hypothetical protein
MPKFKDQFAKKNDVKNVASLNNSPLFKDSLPAWKQRQMEQQANQAAKHPGKEKDDKYQPPAPKPPTAQNPAATTFSQAYQNWGQQMLNQYYQIKKDDKSLDDIALRHNVPLDYVSQLNKTKTLPPVGSYIQLVSQGVPPSVASSITGGYRPPTTNQTNKNDDFYGRHSTAINAAAQINQQLSAGQLPTQIPVGALPFIRNKNGQALTTQTAQQLGYVLNSNGMLVQAGSPQANRGSGSGIQPPSADFMQTQAYATGTGAGVPFLKQLRYDPETKKYHSIEWFLKKGKLDIKTGRAKKGKLRRGGGNPRPAAPPTPPPATTFEGPQTILDIHLGSG